MTEHLPSDHMNNGMQPAEYMGWLRGLEPPTLGITSRCQKYTQVSNANRIIGYRTLVYRRGEGREILDESMMPFQI